MTSRRRWWLQALVVLIALTLLGVLVNNLTVNLIRTGLGLSFRWLVRPAGFALAEHPLPYAPSDSYAWALLMGWLNSLKVILAALILATLFGVSAGAARRSVNPLLRWLAAFYVGLIRQIPLLLQLLFWYFVAFLGLPSAPNSTGPLSSLLRLSNQGIELVGVPLSVEFSAVLVGLSAASG